uniref:Uncharacterized protein n=1 Tax=Panagrolaimus sp. JU765 TaxID=591449 RepID=A0AC34QDV0_9BILA
MSSVNRLLFVALLVFLVLANLCVESFVLQELPLYRTERNLEDDSFGRALRSRQYYPRFPAFHEPYFMGNYPPNLQGYQNP